MAHFISTENTYTWSARDFANAAEALGVEVAVLLKTIALLGRGQVASGLDEREDYYMQGLSHAAVVLARSAAGLAARAQVEAMAETAVLVARFGSDDDRDQEPVQ